MKKRRSWRVPIGFLAAAWFIYVAKPQTGSIIVGALVMFVGEAIRIASAGTLKKYQEVARTGIYTYTRNPLYIGSFLLGIGASIMGRTIPFGVVFIIGYLILYSRVIKREETFLALRYGAEYEQYLTEVPRIFPRHFSLGPIIRESSFSRALHNKEGRTILGIAVVIAIMVLKAYLTT